MSNISKIRKIQEKIESIQKELNSFRIEEDNKPSQQDILVDFTYEENYFGANELANVLQSYSNTNKDFLSEKLLKSINETIEGFNDIVQKEEKSKAFCRQYEEEKYREIKILRAEITELMKEEFNFDSDSVNVFKVPLRFITQHKDLLNAFFEENDINYKEKNERTLVFLDPANVEDLRDIIQKKIKEVDPEFNFKSYAARSQYYLGSNDSIEFLYS
jgi:predicted nucleotidyltransferase